jgi:hypothetical protein
VTLFHWIQLEFRNVGLWGRKKETKTLEGRQRTMQHTLLTWVRESNLGYNLTATHATFRLLPYSSTIYCREKSAECCCFKKSQNRLEKNKLFIIDATSCLNQNCILYICFPNFSNHCFDIMSYTSRLIDRQEEIHVCCRW